MREQPAEEKEQENNVTKKRGDGTLAIQNPYTFSKSYDHKIDFSSKFSQQDNEAAF